MKNQLFNTVKITRPRSNSFDLSHEKKLSCNMGDLVPILLQEVVPGDKFRANSEILMRLAPMISPVMHRVNVYTHYFFVPMRLIYSDWQTFITGGEDGKQTANYPKIDWYDALGAYADKGTLADYMGLPTDLPPGSNSSYVSALPFRAYQMIYNEYYRDQNLEPKIDFSISGGNPTMQDTQALLTMRKRAWEKDYFTSALPWAQRGGDVLLPNTVKYAEPAKAILSNGNLPASGNIQLGQITDNYRDLQDSGSNSLKIENVEGLEITINELRRATRLQEWLEKNARAGSRYIEQIMSHFGVKSSDARLQRPEYLGGGKQPIVISEVLSTFNNETVPGGEMYGHGISVGKSNSFTKFFEEHGYVIGIVSTLPRTAYQNNIHRMWTKFDKLEYYWPEFANLGEQEVYNKELYYTPADTENMEVFGYQSRYAEYKFAQSSVHGDFKDTQAHWHMGRIFGTRPQLNASFVQSDPTHRIFAVETPEVHKLYLHIYNDVKALRPMPIYGTPTL